MNAKIYGISDLHFGHKSMAIKRGFDSEEEHDQHIIESWNSIIKKIDTVFILGDITMEKKQGYVYLDKLRGYKKVILGNHDMPQHIPELLKYVNSVCGMFKYKDSILTHCPIHESEINRFKFNYHGHVHENSLPDERYVNLSAEVLNYKPIELK